MDGNKRTVLTDTVSPILYRLRRGLRQSFCSNVLPAFGDGFEARIEHEGDPSRDNAIEELPAVDEVESITFVFAGFLDPSSEEPLESLVFVGSHVATGSHLVGGREPDPAVPGEFVATKSFVDMSGSQLGDSFELVTFTSSQADASGFDGDPAGPSTTATLVGLIEGATELQDAYAYVVFSRSEHRPNSIDPILVADRGFVSSVVHLQASLFTATVAARTYDLLEPGVTAGAARFARALTG